MGDELNPSTEHLIAESKKLVHSVKANAAATHRQIDAARAALEESTRILSSAGRRLRPRDVGEKTKDS